MSLRNVVEKNQLVFGALAVVLLCVCVYAIYTQLQTMFGSSQPGSAFYTTDDGESWFRGDLLAITPFMSDGKEAVKAHVFQCGRNRFVGFLSRYAPWARENMERFHAAKAAGGRIPPEVIAGLTAASSAGMEFKRPGEDLWVPQANAAEVSRITSVQCEDGSPVIAVTP